MRKRVLAALAVAMLATGAPAAAEPYEQVGGCDLAAAPAGQGYEGVLSALAVIYDGAGRPVNATLTCEVHVNGSAVAAVSASGTTVLAQAGRVAYTAADTDSVQLCEFTTVSDGGAEWSSCEEVTRTQVPPQEVLDTFDMAVALVESVVMQADSTWCPVLQQLAGTYGPVDVNSQGDVFVVGDPMWDCPPYDIGVLPPAHRLPPPMYYQGGIVIANHGAGTTWQPTGLLANARLWHCGRDTSQASFSVVCDWVGGFFPPVCRNGAATAVALPAYNTSTGAVAWGAVRTRTLCVGNWLAELVEAGPATGTSGNQFHFGQRRLSTQYAWQVQCQADNGSGGPPVRTYASECDFLF